MSAEMPVMPPLPDWLGVDDDLSPASPTGVAGWIDMDMPDFGDFPTASPSEIFGSPTQSSDSTTEIHPHFQTPGPADEADEAVLAGARSLTDTPVERLEPDSLSDLYLPGNPQTSDILARLLSEFPDAAIAEIPEPKLPPVQVSVSAPIVPALFPTAPDLSPPDLPIPEAELPLDGFFPGFGSLLPELPAPASVPPALSETADPLARDADADPMTASFEQIRTLRVPPKNELAASVLNYGLVAAIAGTKPFFQFRVEHTLPPGVRLLGSEPMPSRRNGDRLTWEFGTLKPGDKYRIQMRVEPTGPTVLNPDTFAGFETFYSHATTHQTRVTRTSLEASLQAPASVELGEKVELAAEVFNTGNWPATDATLTFVLPEGFEHPQGREVVASPGRIAAGEKVRVAISVRATRAGSHAVELFADCEGTPRTSANAEIVVTAPELRLDLLPPVRITVGQAADVRLDIRNVGTGLANNVRASLQWPDGLEFVAADHSGKAVGRQVVWGFDDLPSADTLTLRVTLRPTLPGDYLVKGGCSSERVSPVTSEGGIRAEIDVRQNRQQIDEFVAMVNSRESELVGGLTKLSTGIAGTLSGGRAGGGGRADILQQQILFQLGDTEYALPIRSVVEVGRSRTITPLPNVAPWLLGLSNLRGDVISVVDLRRFLGLEPSPLSKNYRVIVIRAGRDQVTAAVVVDRINGTAVVPDASVRKATSPIEDPVAPYMKGVAEREGRLLVLLDVDRLLLSPAFGQYAS